VAVAGFGGMRDTGDTLAFAPRLSPPLTKLRFRLLYRGRRLQVEISPEQARYELLAGDPLQVLHHGEPVTLRAESPHTLGCPERLDVPAAVQPLGRAAGQPGVGREANGLRIVLPPGRQ
jgi:alpha,alpha-trehalose phosphorylase